MRGRATLIRLVLLSSVLLPLGCTFEDLRAVFMSGTGDEAVPAVIPALAGTEAAYMPFEHGFMVHIAAQTCLYAYASQIILLRDTVEEYNNYRYCLPFADLPAAPVGVPQEPFGRVWSHYAEVSSALGNPTGSVVYYMTTIPRSDPVIMGGVFYAGIITLPDGTQLLGVTQLRRVA